MFLGFVSREERQAIAKLVAFVCAMDGKICKEEREFVERFLARAELRGYDVWTSAMSESLESICGVIRSGPARLIALTELVEVAHVDRDFSREERLGIAAIAGQLGVEPDRLADIEGWVAEGLAWKQRGFALVGVE